MEIVRLAGMLETQTKCFKRAQGALKWRFPSKLNSLHEQKLQSKKKCSAKFT